MNLSLPDHYVVGYFGFSGSTSSPLVDSTQMQVCEEWKPHKMFIQVTGNDIPPLYLAVDVVQGIWELMTDFHSVEFSDHWESFPSDKTQRNDNSGLQCAGWQSEQVPEEVLQTRYPSAVLDHPWTSETIMEYLDRWLYPPQQFGD